MIHTLFSWSPTRSLQLAYEALSEEETILKQGLAHVQMSQKHQSFSRGKTPAETQHVCDLAVQKKGTTCQKALVAEGLGVRLELGNLGASCVIGSTFLDYCFVIFPAGHDQVGKKHCPSPGCLCVTCWQGSAAASESQHSPWAAFPMQEGFRWQHIPHAVPLPPVPAVP